MKSTTRQTGTRQGTTAATAAKTNKKPRRPTRSELNEQAWQRKRQKKRRGNPPGSRFNIGQPARPATDGTISRDPRIGSKKPVPLTGNHQATDETTINIAEQSPATARRQALSPDFLSPDFLSPQQELAHLENDPRLDKLLDQLDAGETLDNRSQQWLDKTLARIEQLMAQLGISDDADDATPASEDIMRLLKGRD